MVAIEEELQRILEYYRSIWLAAINLDFSEWVDKAVQLNKDNVAGLRKRYDGLRPTIKSMGEKSKELGKAYDELINAFAAVGELMELAEKPTGSYQSFAQRLKDLHATFTQARIKAEALSP